MKADDRISSLVILILSIFTCFGASKLHIGSLSKPGAGTFPFLLGAVTGSLSLLILIKRKFEKQTSKTELQVWSGAEGRGKVLIILLALVVYGFLLEKAGYAITSFLLFILLLKGHKWHIVIGCALLASVGSYILFRIVLHLDLPQGFLGI